MLVFILVSSAVFALAPEARESNAPTAGLPDSADSTTVARIQEQLPTSDVVPAIVVVSRDGEKLDTDDRGAVAELATTLRGGEPRYSDDGTVGLVAVPLKATTGADQVEKIRTTAARCTSRSQTRLWRSARRCSDSWPPTCGVSSTATTSASSPRWPL